MVGRAPATRPFILSRDSWPSFNVARVSSSPVTALFLLLSIRPEMLLPSSRTFLDAVSPSCFLKELVILSLIADAPASVINGATALSFSFGR